MFHVLARNPRRTQDCTTSALRPEQKTKDNDVSLSNDDDQSHVTVIPRTADLIRPRLLLPIEQTFSTAAETNHTSSLSSYKTHNSSNQCLRGNAPDPREGALDHEAPEEVDAPIHANDLEAVVTNIDEVTAIVVTETENASDDQGVL